MKLMPDTLLTSAIIILICEFYDIQGQTVHPGIRVRVTNKGLQYADNDVGIPTLLEKLQKDKIRDISRKERGLEYTLSDIKIKKCLIASSSLSTASGEGLRLQATGIDLDIALLLRYKKKVLWFHVKDKVNVELKVRGVAFNLKTRIGVDSTGHPTISTHEQDCSSQVRSVDVHFSGSRAKKIYNLFKRRIADKIKDALKKKICKEAEEAINRDAAKYLATYPVLRKVGDVAQIDYTLVANPTFTSQYMDVPLKGEFKSRRYPHATAMLVPKTIPDFAEVDKMVYIWLTDYVFNTASLVFHHEGKLRTTIRPRDLPPSARYQLNTKFFKNFLYQLYKLYPDRPVFLKAYTSKAPVFVSSPNNVNVTVAGNIEVYVISKNGTNIYALTLGVKVNVHGSVGVKQGNLTFHTNSFGTKLHVVRSAIGDIETNVGLLQWFLNGVESGKVVKKLNVIGERGFPLPMLRKLKWEDTEVITGQGFVLIKTNVKYSPTNN